jgi:CheY-like chemotaxis protein
METTDIRVLLVDDDTGFGAIIKHLLGPFQGRKFEVTWVNDGDKALDHLREKKPTDLILMDFYLPNRNGLEVARQLIDEGFKLPIIILTANRDFRAAVEALKYGVEDYVLKEEIGDSILPRTILNVLERSRLRQQLEAAEKHNLFSRRRTEAVKELVVTMCHEFNNPLAAIKISAAILGRNQTSREEGDLLNKLNTNISILENQIIKLRDINNEKR